MLTDDAARKRIREETGSTLFVEAGAGSGKTTSLVERIATLVLVDGVRLAAVAAVTFTEKAGAELRDRLRGRLEEETRSDDDPVRRDRAVRGLEDLDGAAIGTLHSFAQRILAEHPIEAGIPPLVEVLDEVGSSVAFTDRWTAMYAELLDDDAMAEPLLIGLSRGIKREQLRAVAQRLGNDWDLIQDRILAAEPMPLALPDLERFADEARRVCAYSEDCTAPADLLLKHFTSLAAILDRFDSAPNDQGRLAQIEAIGKLSFANGVKGNWPDKEEAAAAGKELAAKARDLLQRVTGACLRHLTRWIAQRVLDAADERRKEGRLEFHDLLVLSRELLRRDADVRQALHDSYRRLLLDEFQDTDPIQIELAVRIAGGADATAERWQDVEVELGRLFMVGDPKQSIYRFRRASIATYLEAEQHIDSTVKLTTNFRSVPPLIERVNDLFGALIRFEDLAQPAYEPLAANPALSWNEHAGPAFTVLGAAEHTDKVNAEALRIREAADVAATVRRVLIEQWRVRDEETGEWRPARLTDIAILLPARTSLPFLKEALDRSSIEYRAEASSLVYQAQEVRDLLAAARAIADPSDAFALVTALRSPLLGCSDADLWRFKNDAKGAFNLFAPLTDEQRATPVGAAIDALRGLANRARWMSPSEVLGTLVADRRMFEVAAEPSGSRARDSWRRLRFVIDQARAWSEVSEGGLRAYLAWAAFQGEEGARVAEAVLPETDSESVRIMTIHAAKGLEFPIVIMSGMSSVRQPRPGVRLLWTPTGYEVQTGAAAKTEEFDVAAPLDEQMGDLEHIRLLYVATTRARDHLVVSLHRPTRKVKSSAHTIAEVMPAGFESDHPDASADALAAGHRPVIAPPPPLEIWAAGVEDAQRNADRVRVRSASGLEGTAPELVLAEATEQEQGSAKGQRDAELPPWSKGRYGSAIGRAVHGVLQVVDLAAGPLTSEFHAAVEAQSVAEGVVEQSELVGTLAASALESDAVQRAAAGEHWRETFAGTVDDGGSVVEGFIDLLYREPDGSLVVVDYKTDAVPAAGIPSRVTYYRPQIEAYIRAISDATGATVRGVLVFLNPTGAIEARV